MQTLSYQNSVQVKCKKRVGLEHIKYAIDFEKSHPLKFDINHQSPIVIKSYENLGQNLEVDLRDMGLIDYSCQETQIIKKQTSEDQSDAHGLDITRSAVCGSKRKHTNGDQCSDLVNYNYDIPESGIFESVGLINSHRPQRKAKKVKRSDFESYSVSHSSLEEVEQSQ